LIDHGKFNIVGVNVHAVDYQAAISKIVQAAKVRKPLGVSALAVHGVMTGVMDNIHRHRLNQLELVVPDGQPVRWALNMLHGTKLKDRVYGPKLMLETCKAAAEEGLSVFLFGGKQELLDDLSASLLKKYPSLKIAGMLPSRFRTVSPTEKREIVDTIAASGASITLVGLGCMPVLAVGAAFNFHAGQLAQAPPLMQKYGLEWLFRFLKEPRRLWHRYLVLNPYYVFLVALQLCGVRKFDTQSTETPTSEILYG